MMRCICRFYELGSKAIQNGVDFNRLKEQNLETIDKLNRMKFIDSNKDGVDAAVKELEAVYAYIEQKLGSDL